MSFLSWYKNQINKFGTVKATKLFVTVYGSRLKSEVLNKLLPPKITCPICGWKGYKFFDYIDGESFGYNVECPQCLSHGRHRALFFWLKNDFQLEKKIGTALVCAPEKPLAPLWKSSVSLKSVCLDIEPSRGVDILADLQEIPLADDSRDIIWCHHVLEQIPNDKKALAEFYRVLRPETGTLIISSAMSSNKITDEYGHSDIYRFGNWRCYGQDFPEKLADCGFFVKPVEYGLNTADYEKFGINPEEETFLCQKSKTT